ncbi:alpha/beta hydrolase family protein [Actinoallomurus sp. CA-150999]|uniref:alpha/beta hydrolase family protein n=1 Tax=Actinoallomurus sp. CA-150999 TaxID=3239887 RepID=UPI003D8C63EC
MRVSRIFDRSVTILSCSGLLVFAGLAARTADHYARGAVMSTVRVAHLSSAETADVLTKAKITTPVQNGVDAYRVLYRTVNTRGTSTPASGLLVLPAGSAHRLRLVAYEHGTLTTRRNAPSVDATQPDRARAIMFASAGYAVAAPDYLGLGKGVGRHAYEHVSSELNASVDLLRAARTVVGRQHREFDSKVLVTGFAQGGPAAMALGEKLQDGKVQHFGPAAVAPVSGPFDLEHVQVPAELDGRLSQRQSVLDLAYWLASTRRVYHLYRRPAEAFQEPYASSVTRLFDGHHDEATIVASLPSTPERLLTPAFADRLRHPAGGLLRAMKSSDDTCAWRPRVPVRIYAATGDRRVPIANARACQAASGGGLVDLGARIDHDGSARLALPQILTWFRELAPPT